MRRLVIVLVGLAAIMLVFAALGAVLLARGQIALGQATTTVRIGSGQGDQGTDVIVPLEAVDVPEPGLGAITVDIVYDDSLQPTAWSKTGSPLDIVTCNLDLAPNTVICIGISAVGVSGDVLVANLTFHLVGAPGECDPLAVQVFTFTDTHGNAIAVTHQDGQICITCPDGDGDGDGVCDGDDNCPLVANPGQEDGDSDGKGNVCDNCPSTANADQADLDGDGKGDVCDSDMDGDGFSNSDEEYYGSDPRDKTSTPESLAIAGTCTDGKDNDGDGDMDANEKDGPDGDTAGDCAAIPPPPPTPTPSPTATATPTPTATPGVLPAVSIPMVAGWNDKCYAGEEMAIEDALSGIEDKVLAVYILNESQAFEGWFPDNPGASIIDTLHPYDQLFVLMSEAGSWKQEQSTQTRASVNLVQGWNSICYTGETKPVEEATSGIADAIAILYKLSDTQAWDLYVPGGVGNISTLTKLDSVLVLVTAEGGIIWVFDS